jgi:GMP synthase PP-ATPase subunit
MKRALFSTIVSFIACALAASADLPTTSVEHLYYLRVRGEHIRRLSADDMIEYCVTQKIGGRAFDDLYSQLASMRIELAKLQRVEGLSDEDSRVKTLKKTYAAYYGVLSDEAQKIQRGMLREGQIAADTLELIGRTQQGR